MSLSKILITALGAMVINSTSAATFLSCPATIKDHRHTHKLYNAALFDGVPEEHSDLMPDTDKEEVWTLPDYQKGAKDRGTALYFVCQYKNTERTVKLKVPEHAKKCSVYEGKNRTHATCE